VPQAVADAAGVREQPGRPISQTVAEHLGENRGLLVLDNSEHLVDAAARLVDFLLASCPYLRVLATSREPLGVEGEVLFSVPPLPVPAALPAASDLAGGEDSVGLFVERARLRLPGFLLTQENARSVVEFYRQAKALSIAGTELSRQLGIGHYITGYFDTLGASASGLGPPVRAVRLWAAARSLREPMGIRRMPAEISFYEPYVQAVRAQLDDATWEMAWSEGQAMSMEQAKKYAQTTAVSVPEKPPAGTRRVALTRSEREVAALLTQQELTNRQIAFELFISEHTVATHIAKMMKKLGLHSRGQITAWVTAQRMRSVGSD
jgi:DNA-binding CsgD family transcriptional regulator